MVIPLISVARRAGSAAAAWTSRGGFRNLFAAQVAAATAGLLVNVLSARGMGPEGRGALAFYLQLAYVGSALVLAGTDRALPAVRRNSLSLRAAEGQMIRLIAPAMALTVLVLAGGFAAAEVSDASVSTFLFLAAAVALVLWGNTILLSLRAAAIAAESTGRFLKVMVAGQAVLVGGAVVLLALSVESPAIWLCLYGAALLIPACAAFVWSFPELKGSVRDRVATRRLGLRLAPAVIANMVMLRSDRLLLPLLSSPSQLGLYIVVAAVTELIAWPVQSFVDGRVPLWRRALADGTFRVGRMLAGAALFTALGAVVIALVLSVLLVPVFGEQYSPARPLIWPLAVAAGLYAFSRFGVAMTVAGNRSSLAASIDISGMVVAAAGFVLLIPHYGAPGAAVGSLLGYGIAALASAVAALHMGRGSLVGI